MLEVEFDGHDSHVACMVLLSYEEYVSAAQREHASPSLPEYPSLHVQSVNTSLPGRELELDGQLMQSLLLFSSRAEEYCPASHAVHCFPADPLYPWLHTQALTAPLPAGDELSSGQSMHAVWLLAATVVEYFPAGHFVHSPVSVASAYLPAGQSSHADAPGGATVPASHEVQVALEVAAVTLEYLPAWHDSHWSLEYPSLYPPGSHGIQMPFPFGLFMYPGLHLQSKILLELSSSVIECSHSIHSAAPRSDHVSLAHDRHVLLTCTTM